MVDLHMNSLEASGYLLSAHGMRIAPETLANLRSRGTGPTFRRIGRAVVYIKTDLDEYAASRLSPPLRSTKTTSAAVAGDEERRIDLAVAGINGDASIGAIFVEQKRVIHALFGDEAASSANYGWGADHEARYVETKVYGQGVLISMIDRSGGKITHQWKPFPLA